jgi:predicted MFS family arabinose efflux permease
VRFDRALLANSNLLIFGISLAGFLGEYVLRPVIPLLVIDRGGGATLIGIVMALFALPSIALRPAVGSMVDRWRQRQVLGAGSLLALVSPLGLLLPGAIPLVLSRFVQGTAWAVSTVSTRTIMAQATPSERRAEASAYFAAMPALAVLVAPGVGVAVYLATGAIGPVVLSMAMSLTAFVMILRLPPDVTSGASQPDEQETGGRVVGWLFERSVVPAMAMTAAFMAADTLFSVFPPVFIAMTGERVESLAVYYPVYGLASAASLFTVGRFSNRLPRGAGIRIGCAFSVVGLAVAILGNGLVMFGIGAAIYALGAAFASAALGALSIDRAPPHRLGSAMATYSIGFQLAIGASAVVWGSLITSFGFDAALGAALALVLTAGAASYRYADREGHRALACHSRGSVRDE